ncbi:hypothetical protein GQX73_g6033 [Xylaria multiplex]|uniref:Uncharacterized protein n=1 Tax=Xylaria multiplex TaxID=323545 RepID=A0A7C8MNN2_9PEZI|nr:hypothetical protein GQX73_g6033 [Xylaria multiplex]
MTDGKKHHRKTRHQPRRTASTSKIGVAEASDITISHSSAGVHRSKGKSRSSAGRQRKKFQEALIKRIDARGPEAWGEQALLLGLGETLPPESPTITKPSTPRGQDRRKAKGKKYVDDILDPQDHIGDLLGRENRWIPNFEHRKRPAVKPPGIPFSLWMSYKHLDDFIYRYSLSQAELEAMPMLEDVHEYQDSDGRTPKPITPPGYRWDENLELIPMED